MQEPQIVINWGAIAACVVGGMVFGFLWYGPIFGRIWGRLMGFAADFKPTPAQMKKAMILQVVSLFLMAYVLAHSGQIWRPSVWNYPGDEGPDFMWGFMSAFFTWIGFFLPMQFSKVAWENRPWKLFFINIGHDFINLQIISQILAHWR